MTSATVDHAPTDAAAAVADSAARLAERMTTEYTPIWEVVNFMLDAAQSVDADPLAVAEIHELLAELAPSTHRSVVRTAQVREIVASVRRIADAPVQAAANAS